VFIGHYGVSLAVKPYSPRLSLGWLFLAVQLLDVLFSIFVLLGIERMRIVHGFTAYNPYDLYWMPYSHSLVGASAWSLLAAGVCLAATRRWPPGESRVAAVVFGAAVFSHFVLDVPVHTPDLPLWPGAGSPRIGLGLWNHPLVTTALELFALVAGGVLYLRATRAKNRGYAVATAIFGGLLVVLTIGTRFQPDPASGRSFAIRALVSYVVLAVVAGAVDHGRPMRRQV
jgi:hypothetical protein